MTNFFIYLEKVLTNVSFFGQGTLARSKNATDYLNDQLKKGNVFIYFFKNNIHFNFKIGETIYELAFITEYDENLMCLGILLI